MSPKQWVFDPDSGGVKVKEKIKRRTEERIIRYAESNLAGRYTMLNIRFRSQFCYVDAYTEPQVSYASNLDLETDDIGSENSLIHLPAKRTRVAL